MVDRKNEVGKVAMTVIYGIQGDRSDANMGGFKYWDLGIAFWARSGGAPRSGRVRLFSVFCYMIGPSEPASLFRCKPVERTASDGSKC